ncbi:MAG: PBP1A family penicillin-binding protein [Candidatus Moraniibacteriota bacterium]
MKLWRKKRKIPRLSAESGRFSVKNWRDWNWPKIRKYTLWGGGAGFLLLSALFLYVAKDLPDPKNIHKRVVAQSTKIYDRTGEHLLYDVHGEERRTVIPFSEMPENVRAATIALEDQNFYHHFGIQPKAILRALLKDIVAFDTAQGASTITQQFVKNSLLSNESTFTRKAKEAILSIELETLYSKDEILEFYLNEIPYGQNAYGIEAASQTFFGKSARDLTLDEAAVLASMPRGTTYYSPYSHPDRLVGRKDYALQQMAKLGYITEEQAEQATAVDTLAKLQPQKDLIAAPHFVMFIKDYLQQKYGDQAIEQNGYKVITTLDWDKQQAAEEAVKKGAENNKRWKAENAALVAMDPKTGQLLAMVGSKDYFDTTIDGQVNISVTNQQPGSSFKPYVYLTAFSKGYLPETMLYDTETEFATGGADSYKPQNYNGQFNGPIQMKRALGGSLNVPAVKTLYLAGVEDSVTLAHSLGITGIQDPKRVGLSLVLGGGDVTLLDHVHANATLATGGIYRDQTAILRIEDSSGEVVEEFKPSSGKRVVEEKYIAMLDSILSNNENRAWIFGENSPLRFDNRQVAAKTGTTNEFRDGWTLGYTPSLAVGVWAGNNDNTPMAEGADGVNVAAPIWRAFLDKTLTNYAIEEFPKYNPDDEIGEGDGKTNKPMLAGKLEEEKDIKVCELPDHDGEYCLANKYCPEDEEDEKDFVSTHDILYYVNREDPRGAAPKDPKSDPEYENFEKGVQEWYKKQGKKEGGEVPRDECDSDDFDDYKPDIDITTSGEASSSSLKLSVKVDAPYGVKKVSYRVDGDDAGSSDSKPYSVNYSLSDSKNNSTVTIEAKIEDKNGNTATDKKDVRVRF